MNSYPVSSPSEAYITNHEIHQVQSNPKGIFVDLDVSSHHTPRRPHRSRFWLFVQHHAHHSSGKAVRCRCNAILTRLFDYYTESNYFDQRSSQAKLFTPGQLVWSGGSDHYIPTVLSSPAWFGGQHSQDIRTHASIRRRGFESHFWHHVIKHSSTTDVRWQTDLLDQDGGLTRRTLQPKSIMGKPTTGYPASI